MKQQPKTKIVPSTNPQNFLRRKEDESDEEPSFSSQIRQRPNNNGAQLNASESGMFGNINQSKLGVQMQLQEPTQFNQSERQLLTN